MLNERECYWISALVPKYNMTKGGDGGDTSDSPNYKRGMSTRLVHPKFISSTRMTGLKHTTESRAKQSKARSKFWEEITDEERAARAQKLSGKKNGMYGKIPKNSCKILYNGVEYDSLAKASRETGLSTYHLKKLGDII